MKISEIIYKIDHNQLFIPAFQREYVWKREHAKKLIDSLIKDYPTGSMLTWETNNPPELKGTWIYNSSQGSIKLILDGQQRITTLYLLIQDKIPPYYTDAEIINNPRGLYVNIVTLELEYFKKIKMQSDPYWVNVTEIFQKKKSFMDIRRDIEKVIGANMERTLENEIFQNYTSIERIPTSDFVEQCIPGKARLKEAIDIFYIVNASGVNLTDAELALAQISGYWPKAREEFKLKLAAMKEHGFIFNLDFIVYCLLGILYNIGSDMSKLHDRENEEKLKAIWKDLNENVLDYVANILRTHAFVDHTNEINSVYALIPIIVYVYKKGKKKLTTTEIKKIVKWFYYSQIRQRYISQLGQKLDKDIGLVVRAENPFDELINIIRMERSLEITPEEFIGVDIRNALYSLMRWYFKSKGAVCFTTGVGIRQNMGVKYSLEWDHIFPFSLLKEKGYGTDNRLKYPLAQEVTNRAVLTQIGNRGKSIMLPKPYLLEVKQNFPNALELQSVPEDENLWETDRYEDFLQARRVLLSNELNTFLNNITSTEESHIDMTLEELIREGESSELELKSSIRWSYQEEKINAHLEVVIMRTIAAFANAEGGILIIGANDDTEIIGLERDYSSLNGDKDKFEIHLRNLINTYFNKVFAATNLGITFPEINGIEICRIDIKKSKDPIFIEVAGENGQKLEKFFLRSGNSSPELKPSEIQEYVKTRFGG